MPERAPLRVTVVGAGIAGLATAYYLDKTAPPEGLDLQVLEKAARPGGKIITESRGGYLLEGGPDAFLRQKPWAEELARDLGLSDQIIQTRAGNNDVHVLVRGELKRFPPGMLLVVPTDLGAFLRSGLLSPSGRARAVLDLVLPRSEGYETIAGLIGSRFGPEAVDRLAQPLLAGIYAGDAEELGIEETFPQLAAMARDHGSLIKGARKVMGERRRAAESGDGRAATGSAFASFEGGMATLTDGLALHLQDRLRVGGPAVMVERRRGDEGMFYRIRTRDGFERDSDILVMATPAPVTASLLVEVAPHVARGAAAIPHVATGTVSLAYPRSRVDRLPSGYGFLVSGSESTVTRGCTIASTKFEARAPEDMVLLRAFVGGRGREADVAQDDEPLIMAVHEEFRRLLGLREPPELSHIVRWPEGQPQYLVGHSARIASLRESCPTGLYLVGAAYDGVGVPDCVRQGKELAERILTLQ